MSDCIQMPGINMNGTSAQDLLDHQREIRDAARVLHDLLARYCPNGRDYQTLDDGAFTRARRAHDAKREQVRKIETEAMQIALHIVETSGAEYR